MRAIVKNKAFSSKRTLSLALLLVCSSAVLFATPASAGGTKQNVPTSVVRKPVNTPLSTLGTQPLPQEKVVTITVTTSPKCDFVKGKETVMYVAPRPFFLSGYSLDVCGGQTISALGLMTSSPGQVIESGSMVQNCE